MCMCMGKYDIKKTGSEKNLPRITAEQQTTHFNIYESFLADMNGNPHVKKSICDTDDTYVRTFKVKSQTSGKVIELHCPSLNAISISGKNQAAEPKDLNRPYVFCIRCFDNEDREPGPATHMNFKKVLKDGGISRAWRALYGDLTKAYSFPEGLYLSENEILQLEVLNPDRNIERIELSMEADIFETRVC